MAKDSNICPLLAMGKFASHDLVLDKNDKKESGASPSSANCRETVCHWWDDTNTQCMWKTYALAP